MKKIKNAKRIAALWLAGLLGCSGLVACGGGGGGTTSSSGGDTTSSSGSDDITSSSGSDDITSSSSEDITSSSSTSGSKEEKTILKVKVFNGGLGYEWLQELANKFSEQFKDVSFEPGKKGVELKFTADKDFSSLYTKMATGADKHDLYYTSDSNFYNFMESKVAYDVTDIMTEEVYDSDGYVQLAADGKSWKEQSKSIADRITSEHIATRLNVGSEDDPQYFALPFEDSTAGIIVDWDLFKAKGWNNYNGIDGMPATINDFYNLLNRIRQAGYSAFIYGTGVQYTRVIQDAVIAQVDGTETYYDLFSDYTGEYDFNGDETITEDEKITPATAYKILDTKGVKAAVEMATKMFEKNSAGKTFYDPAVADGVEFGEAQQEFLMSVETTQPIAMLFEGEWWENEARATFNAMGEDNPDYAYGKREFRMMPIPSFESTNEAQRYTLGAWTGGACTIVNEKLVGDDEVKQEVLKLWLQYQYSTEGMKCFSKYTGATLPIDYELSRTELKELTPFAQNMYALRKDDKYNVEVIYNGDSLRNEQIRKGGAQLSYNTEGYAGNVLFNLMLKRSKGNKMLTVEDYIVAMHAYQDQDIADVYAED